MIIEVFDQEQPIHPTKVVYKNYLTWGAERSNIVQPKGVAQQWKNV